ncbi:hypothetical protein GCM10025791_47640 [Halioxenophilus aromaticivorans]|uniref:Uncharacterized protein n=1 Tax=Halioxenophilus aromaticivorans TaxID=1306992 RepID=A0AAV3UAF4_9ALTE
MPDAAGSILYACPLVCNLSVVTDQLHTKTSCYLLTMRQPVIRLWRQTVMHVQRLNTLTLHQLRYYV